MRSEWGSGPGGWVTHGVSAAPVHPGRGLKSDSIRETFAQTHKEKALGRQCFRWGPGNCSHFSTPLSEVETEKDSEITENQPCPWLLSWQLIPQTCIEHQLLDGC